MLKNLFFLITLSIAISSCGGNSDQTRNHTDSSTNAVDFNKDVKNPNSVESPAPAVSIANSSDKGAQLIIQKRL